MLGFQKFADHITYTEDNGGCPNHGRGFLYNEFLAYRGKWRQYRQEELRMDQRIYREGKIIYRTDNT